MAKNTKTQYNTDKAITTETKQTTQTVTLEALQNTTLADGSFVAQGQKVEVSQEYAERVRAEKNGHFRVLINN